MAARKKTIEKKAALSDYPALAAWLIKIEAQHLTDAAYGTSSVEIWTAKGSVFIVMLYAKGNGWSIFTPCTSNRIDDTLADAERRIGISSESYAHPESAS